MHVFQIRSDTRRELDRTFAHGKRIARVEIHSDMRTADSFAEPDEVRARRVLMVLDGDGNVQLTRQRFRTLQRAADSLVNAANAAGGIDNISVVIVDAG